MPRPSITRREFLSTAAVAAAGLPIVAASARRVLAATQAVRFTPPISPRARINFNLNWKFIREDVAGAEAPDFDDSHWTTISTPHSFNDVDSFRKIISHGGGDLGTYKRAQPKHHPFIIFPAFRGFLGTAARDKSIVCMVGNHPPILCIPLDLVRHNIGVAIHA